MVETMRRSYFGAFMVVAAMALLCMLAGGSGAAAGDTTRVSVGFSHPEGTGISISSDGRYVAFVSGATSLVAGDTNGRPDVFVSDRDADGDQVLDEIDEPGAVSTERASVASDGAEANASSLNPSISDDGRYVVFTSNAPLVLEDTNGVSDVFVRDLKTGTTKRVSVDSAGTQANGQSIGGTSISANGRFVAFRSDASNLLPVGWDGGGSDDVFVRDRDTDDDKVYDEAGAVSTQRVSWGEFVSWSGNGDSFGPSISDDGRYVAFTSLATNLVGGDTNNAYDTFVRDRQTGAIQRVNVDSSENQANGGCDDFFCPNRSVVSISSDGRYVTFSSAASNLAPNDTNGLDDVFVRDLQMGTTQRVSVNSSGTGANALSRGPSISPDGRFVAFTSTSSNLVGGDTNGVYDIFVRDLQMGTTQRVSVSSSGSEANGGSGSASISANGNYVAFSSGATNLVQNDTNNTSDIFVHEQGASTQQPSNRIAPTTSNVTAGTEGDASYTSSTPTNQDVEVTLSAKGNKGGSGAKRLTSSATEAPPITSDTMLEPTSAALGFQAPVKIPAGDSPRSVTSADFDGNGKADLATSNYSSDNVSVLLSDGDGTFQAAHNLTVGDGPSPLTSADFDGDGKADLAVANQLSQNISVLLRDGDGTFQAAKNSPATVSLPGSGTSSSMTSADFNGDGKDDLATSNYSSDNVSVLLSDGNGSLQAAKHFPAGYGPHSVTSADFDGDSKADLAVANQHSDNISVLLGKGDGTFEPAQNFLAADSLRSVTSTDFDEDGKDDLAVAHSSDFSYFWRPNYPEGFSVLLGKGEGTFQPAKYYSVDPQGSLRDFRLPRYVTTADFDGDTKEDLAIANNGSWSAPSSVSVLLGRGDGTLQFDQELSAGVKPTFLAAANLNADRFPDLAVATEGSPDENPDYISVLLNTPRQDLTAPITTRSLSPQPNAAGWNKEDVTVTLNATDNDSGVKEISYSINGGQSTTAEQSSVQIPPITNEGETTISYFATDNAGNVEPPQTFTVELDKSAPSAPVIASPANNLFDTDGTITVSGTAEANSTVRVFEATASGDISKGTTQVDASEAWTKTLSGVPDGPHTYKAKAEDAAGNTSGFSSTRTVMVDKVTPQVSSTTPLAGATNVGRGTNLTGTFSEKMRASSINATTFKLFKVNPDGTQMQITDVVVGLSSDGLKATLNPFGAKTTLLARNTKYKGVLTTGTKDLAGNSLAQQKSWTFTTKP